MIFFFITSLTPFLISLKTHLFRVYRLCTSSLIVVSHLAVSTSSLDRPSPCSDCWLQCSVAFAKLSSPRVQSADHPVAESTPVRLRGCCQTLACLPACHQAPRPFPRRNLFVALSEAPYYLLCVEHLGPLALLPHKTSSKPLILKTTQLTDFIVCQVKGSY